MFVFLAIVCCLFSVCSFVNLQQSDYKELFSFLTNKNIKIYSK